MLFSKTIAAGLLPLTCLMTIANAYALPHWSLHTRQANSTVQITSNTWSKYRQPIPCANNLNISGKYDVSACAAVAARWNVGEETVPTYTAIGPYQVNDMTDCQVYVSNLGAPTIEYSRSDMAAAITKLSALCAQQAPDLNSVVADYDYDGGSVHIEIMALNATAMVAPVTATGSASGKAGSNGTSATDGMGGSSGATSTGASLSGSGSSGLSDSDSAGSATNTGSGSLGGSSTSGSSDSPSSGSSNSATGGNSVTTSISGSGANAGSTSTGQKDTSPTAKTATFETMSSTGGSGGGSSASGATPASGSSSSSSSNSVGAGVSNTNSGQSTQTQSGTAPSSRV